MIWKIITLTATHLIAGYVGYKIKKRKSYSNDIFKIADRSYASTTSKELNADWFKPKEN